MRRSKYGRGWGVKVAYIAVLDLGSIGLFQGEKCFFGESAAIGAGGLILCCWAGAGVGSGGLWGGSFVGV